MTDCIATGVPMVCVYDPNNAELAHNAGRIETLGLGTDIGRGKSDVIEKAVAQLITSNVSIQRNFAKLRTGGALSAARWLADYWRQ